MIVIHSREINDKSVKICIHLNILSKDTDHIVKANIVCLQEDTNHQNKQTVMKSNVRFYTAYLYSLHHTNFYYFLMSNMNKDIIKI